MLKEIDVKKMEQEQKEEKKQEKMCRAPSVCSAGGQALMEGILMRSPHGMSQVVRDPDGYMVIESKPVEMLSKKHKIFGWPLIRGCVSLYDSLSLGMKALFDSAEIAATEEEKAQEEEKKSKFDKWIEKKLGEEGAFNVLMGISLVLAICLSLGLFFFLPLLISGWILPADSPDIVKNLVEGLVRIVIFFGYMIVIALMKDIRRVYMYHGAEHKTIWCFEKGWELNVENVRKCSKHHPRCGTAFLFVVVVVSILVTSVVPRFSTAQISSKFLVFLANFGVRLLLLPFIAGISYEFNRAVGKHENLFTRILRAPGMAMQRFTTKEPDDSMIEVAIVALGHSLAYEGIEVEYQQFEKLRPEKTEEEVPAEENEDTEAQEETLSSESCE